MEGFRTLKVLKFHSGNFKVSLRVSDIWPPDTESPFKFQIVDFILVLEHGRDEGIVLAMESFS